jgi:secreted trypsin-like serine protease
MARSALTLICLALALAVTTPPEAEAQSGPTLFADYVPGETQWAFSVHPQGIVNGYVPPASQWPWMAYLKLGTSWCGGTLIDSDTVLTAAHCITDPPDPVRAANSRVILGRHDLDTSNGEVFAVTRILVHPGWGTGGQGNDLALLTLARPTATTPALIGGEDAWGVTATAMGWGKILEAGPFSRDLLAVQLPLVRDEDCAAVYGQRFDSNVMTCAGGNQRDTCQGDSGGPLMVPGGPRGWLLIGVTSFGDGCARQGVPGVYAWTAGDTLRSWVEAND